MNQETGLSFRQRLAILFFILAVSSAAAGALGQQDSSDEVIDPGPRIGGVGAGNFFTGITDAQQAQAADGAMRFVEPETFTSGLGPYYNCGHATRLRRLPRATKHRRVIAVGIGVSLYRAESASHHRLQRLQRHQRNPAIHQSPTDRCAKCASSISISQTAT